MASRRTAEAALKKGVGCIVSRAAVTVLKTNRDEYWNIQSGMKKRK